MAPNSVTFSVDLRDTCSVSENFLIYGNECIFENMIECMLLFLLPVFYFSVNFFKEITLSFFVVIQGLILRMMMFQCMYGELIMYFVTLQGTFGNSSLGWWRWVERRL